MTGSRGWMATLAILVTLSGLGLGALLALAKHTTTTQATVASTTVVRATMTPAPAATARATATATASPSPARTPVPIMLVASTGRWIVDEANVIDGRMLWTGVSIPQGRALLLELHKQRIAGRDASACERATDLRVAFTPGAAPQTVPYTETNCNGVAMSGTVRIASASGDDVRGSFWDGSEKLGDFEAQKQ